MSNFFAQTEALLHHGKSAEKAKKKQGLEENKANALCLQSFFRVTNQPIQSDRQIDTVFVVVILYEHKILYKV
jgi:hypothetical protein